MGWIGFNDMNCVSASFELWEADPVLRATVSGNGLHPVSILVMMHCCQVCPGGDKQLSTRCYT